MTDSLTSQVENIKNARTPKTAKKNALLKLGLTPYEVDLLLDSLPKATRKRHTFTFGVEIECLMPRHRFAEAAAANHVRYAYEGYNHVDNRTYFKLVSDASIVGANPIECVSPVLSGKKGFAALEACCKAINEAGATVNRSTGLHVHIGAADLTDEAYCNVFANYASCSGLIGSFMAPSRRNTHWAKRLPGAVHRCHTRREILEACAGDRYYEVNPCAYLRHKTIEFRQHGGTTDYEKISMWVKFCAKLVAYSKKHRVGYQLLTIDEIPWLNAEEKAYFTRRQAHFTRLLAPRPIQ